MTDEQRKALTLYLGEPWTLSYNMRSFTTDADMMALFRKTVDNGKVKKSIATRFAPNGNRTG